MGAIQSSSSAGQDPGLAKMESPGDLLGCCAPTKGVGMGAIQSSSSAGRWKVYPGFPRGLPWVPVFSPVFVRFPSINGVPWVPECF